MNKQMWSLYKESERGKKCIEMFDPNVEDFFEGANSIFEFSNKIDNSINIEHENLLFFQYYANLSSSPLCVEKDFTRKDFAQLVKDYEIMEAMVKDDDTIGFYSDKDALLLQKDNYRIKAAHIQILSVYLFYAYNFFKPMLFRSRFDVIQNNCAVLGIELPLIPRTNNYMEYLMYYYDICCVWDEFQAENDLTDAEFCACIYDYAALLQEPSGKAELPKPINVWLTGASGKDDYDTLEKLTKGGTSDEEQIWACNERTHRGDIIVMYCLSPKSQIHSIWRADSGGMFNPFDYYHCRTTVCDGKATPKITFHDLKFDTYFSQVPIVRKNLQGVNGIQLTAKDYSELLRLIERKGGSITDYPQLFEGKNIEFGEIRIEKDVEEKILIPMLKHLGYTKEDWTRQLSQKAGRGLKAIPDFVFFPKGEKHNSYAPFVIEAKLDMSSAAEQHNAFSQGQSYAHMLRSSLMGICDKERLIIYKMDKHGSADRNAPLFEDHWQSIFGDAEVGARLNQIIGREVVKNINA